MLASRVIVERDIYRIYTESFLIIMLELMGKKATTRLWIIFVRPTFYFCCCTITSAMLIWMVWLGLQHIDRVLDWEMRLLLALLLSFGAGLNTNKAISSKEEEGLSKSYKVVCAVFFLAATTWNGFSILIFPIAVLLEILSFSVIATFDGPSLSDDKIIIDRIESIMPREREFEFTQKKVFLMHFMMTFFASFVGVFLLACVSMGKFTTNLVILGGIDLLFVLSFMSLCSGYERILYFIVCDAFGGSISDAVTKKLTDMYPEGLDTDRIQFLLHDTLKEKRGNNLSRIRELILIFPGVMNIPDDRDGLIPFHLACQYSSVKVVKYMVKMDMNLLNARDARGDTALHHACRGKKYRTVNYLLEANMQLVTKRNADGDLPLNLLCSTTGKNSSALNSPKHLETIWLLILAYPEELC